MPRLTIFGSLLIIVSAEVVHIKVVRIEVVRERACAYRRDVAYRRGGRPARGAWMMLTTMRENH